MTMKQIKYIHKTKIIYVLILLFFAGTIQAQKADTVKSSHLFELSFGQSMLFIDNSKVVDLHTKYAIVMPTSAILFFLELRPHKKFKIPLFFNLPTESKQFLVGTQLVYEKASPTFGFGTEFTLFRIKIDSKSKVEFEVGPLASLAVNNDNRLEFAPIVAGRLRISRGDNFVMYLGTSYSFGLNTWGILYGTGTIF